ncbi:MAG TPA: dTDP-4-dehydrorhamnose 3,5-epimerase [Thermoanaerobaculia bacterium]|nr:dTDP-4-dehydrorhamnose 3,5-epimerase [Thermoanaerobaculia bacterium]
MRFHQTSLPGVLLLEPEVFGDDRGFFMETYRQEELAAAGIPYSFVQDNHSASSKGVLRGLHYQEPYSQGKLLRCVAGSVFDVAVDIRKGSPDFGKWFGCELSAENKLQIWIPPGFAHGFSVISDRAEVVYKCTELWRKEFDRAIAWNDPEIGIEWPSMEPTLSSKDAAAPRLSEASILPEYEANARPLGAPRRR